MVDRTFLGMSSQMGRKVVRATEGFVATVDTADKGALLGVHQHVSLKVLIPLEAPATGRDLARVLVVAAVVAMAITAAGRGHARRRAHRVVALDLDTQMTVQWVIVLIVLVLLDDNLGVLARSIQGAVLEGNQESKTGGRCRADRIQGRARHEALGHG